MSGEENGDLQVGHALRDRFEAGELFVPVPSLTWLEITGDDRAKVFGNLTTNHVASLTPGTGLETFVTDVRGKTLSHGMAYATQDRLEFCTVANQYDRLANHIDKYVIREDVHLSDLSQDLAAVFWPGIRGSKLWNQLGLPDTSIPPLTHQTLALGDLQVRAYQVPWTRPDDWLFVVGSGQIDHLHAELVAKDILPGNIGLMHAARIANRFPWFGVDCIESNLPQEMDRDSLAISFTKGCYLGQETVARLDAMGQVQKKLTLWKFNSETVPQPGAELTNNGKVVATVTSSAYCFALDCPIALCIARRSHFDAGASAESPVGSAEVI